MHQLWSIIQALQHCIKFAKEFAVTANMSANITYHQLNDGVYLQKKELKKNIFGVHFIDRYNRLLSGKAALML